MVTDGHMINNCQCSDAAYGSSCARKLRPEYVNGHPGSVSKAGFLKRCDENQFVLCIFFIMPLTYIYVYKVKSVLIELFKITLNNIIQ